MRRQLGGLALVVAAVACAQDGDSTVPTAPGGPPTEIPSGRYLLGLATSGSFCGTIGNPRTSSVQLSVQVERIGDGWRLRLPNATGQDGGNLEAHFLLFQTGVAGTIQGTGAAADGATVTISGATGSSAATLTGYFRPVGVLIEGSVGGSVTFTDRNSSIFCSENSWTLMRP